MSTDRCCETCGRPFEQVARWTDLVRFERFLFELAERVEQIEQALVIERGRGPLGETPSKPDGNEGGS